MLRKELQPPEINQAVLPEVENLIKYFEEVLESEEWDDEGDKIVFADDTVSREVNEKKSELEDLIKAKVDILQFEDYSCACDAEEMAMDLLMPEAPYVSDISVEELTELINEFQVLEQIAVEHENYYLRLLEKSFKMDVSDYIFWPDTKGMSLDASPDEIAQKIIEDSKNGQIII